MHLGIGASKKKRRHGAAQRTGDRLLLRALALSLVVPLGLAPTSTAMATAQGLGKPDLPEQRVSKVKPMTGPGAKKAREKVAQDRNANAEQARLARLEQQGTWPKGGTATVKLTEGKAATTAPGGLPLTITPHPERKTSTPAGAAARITVLDQKTAHKAGITGVLLTAQSDVADTAKVSVNYAGFAASLGGNWAQRLRLVQLPACALTTPEKAACRKQTPLASDNSLTQQSVSAIVALGKATNGLAPQLTRTAADSPGATVLAVTAADTGGGPAANGTGNYSATNLSESSSWEAGDSSGSFTWSYDFTVPPAAAGPTPSLSLSYDSGSIDGRTATTNNQGSAVGDGFAISESYIERVYGSCDNDGHKDVFDRCWTYDNATLVLNGAADRLVKDRESGQWRLQGDDASKVTRSTGAANGDDDGEYWTVVTGDGTTYVFGLDKLDGATTQRTNSTWTVPVFGDDSGEPGYSRGSTFADRSLNQAWRWNLDYVVDTHGNAATYWYAKETNYYTKNKAAKASALYTRGGYLKEIKYGLRKGALFTDDADARVTFGYAERCTASDCKELTKDTADNWPDVPFDAICSKDDADCKASSPAFFSRKRLTDVYTYSFNAASGAYDKVDAWELEQQYLDGGDIGDTSDHVLTLKSIKRWGKTASPYKTLNPVSFTYQMRPNRVDATDDILPLTRPRISTITSETGAITTVTLSSPECRRSEVLGAAQDTNTRSCYPQFWNINGSDTASVDWFHKYRVLAVVVSDPAGHNDAVEHEYAYSGAAWHYNDDPLTPKNERTWSDWRGYRQVTVYSGAKSTTRSKTVSLYLQGMHGDKNKDGTTKTVTVAPLASPSVGIGSVTDYDQYAGMLREQATYDGATAIAVSANWPWSKETARQSAPDAGDHIARYTRTKKTTAYTYLTAAKTWRSHTVDTSFDDYGMAYQVEDRGDDARSGDETCTRTWYARNPGEGLTSLTSRTRTVAAKCSVADADLDLPADSSRRGDVLADTATAYDGAAWSPSMKPKTGLATWTGRAQGYHTAGTPSWQKTSATTYDTLGRTLAVTNAAGNTTSTAYTPAEAGPLTRTITTNPKGHKSAAFLDPRRGQPLRSYDVNAKKTELAYDALGRLTEVWLPNRIRGSQAPSSTFTYDLSNTKPSSVATSTLRADGETYNTTYEIYDALLRPLQTQSPTPQGGRLLTDTRYDSRGLAYETYADIFDTTSTPNGTYTRAEHGEAPTQTETAFDGAGRPTTSTLHVFGTKKWSTSTTYTGDSTATTALEGGSATRTITDARGRTVETRAYAGTSPTDTEYGGSLGTAYTSTKFTYALGDQQTSITGPDGAKWTYGYDLFGRKVSTKDPDKGTSTSSYNSLDQLVKATDARGQAILTAYDELGRPTGTWSGTRTDANQLTARTYDTILKGQPATSTRYIGGKNGKAYTKAVTKYDSLSRPVGTELHLPDSDPLVEAGAPATIGFSSHYRIDGALQSTTEPALGSLPKESIEYGYTDLGQVTSIGGSTGYLLNVDYSALSQAQQLTLGTANVATHKKVYVTNTYEEGTGRLTRSHVTDQTHPYMLQDLNYTFDQAGNVTSIADPTTLGGTSAPETQCFAYDGHRRLIEAWTPTSQKCADPRSADKLSGPAPYWTSYTYNTAGQRTSEAQHKPSGTTKTTYCYNSAQPHTLSGTSTKADCIAPEHTYAYDATGNTTKRPGPGADQDLTWSETGQLTQLTENGKTTDYLYDAEGTLLIRNTENGERVLYAGATELHLRANGTTWAQRYYATGDLTIAVRSNETGTPKLTYLAGDHHGTQNLAISADTGQSFSKRHTTPFGAERGKPSGTPWPDDKGFLGKTTDKITGLTHIGARQYDPVIGQFISVDPILQLGTEQTLNGYSYANQNPLAFTDPTGLASMKTVWGSLKKATKKIMRNVSGGGGNSGGRSSTSGSKSGGLGPYKPLGNSNSLSQKSPFPSLGSLSDFISSTQPFGIIPSTGKKNRWETSRAMFFGWLWGMGWPLEPVQEFRGGDVFTKELASDETFSKMRSKLVMQAFTEGMNASAAKEPISFAYRDRGPEPGSPWWKFNSLRGAANDLLGTVTNGAVGTENYADAFLGSYTATGKISSIDEKKGVVMLSFTATNLSDWRSATHVIPRETGNEATRHSYGAAVRENFSWSERLPLNPCVCWVE